MARPPIRAIPVERPGLEVLHDLIFTIEGERVEQTLKGPRRIRTGIIRGLVGEDEGRLWRSLLASGMPRLGSLDPVVDGAILGRMSATYKKDSPGQADFELEYGFFAEDDFENVPDDTTEPQIEVLSTVTPVVTRKDIHGHAMILRHEFIVPDPDNPGANLPPVRGPDQVAELEIQVPNHVVIFRRREQNSPGAVAAGGGEGNKAKEYVGSINSDNIFGDAKHFWLCTQLSGRSDDGGVTYNVTYEFQRNFETWNPAAIYRDPKTGAPILDPTEGPLRDSTPDPVPNPNPTVYGLRRFQTYPEKPFRALNLFVEPLP